MRLTLELVPTSCWYSNVRSNVTAETWNRLQEHCFHAAAYRCEICGGVGPAHPVECHEIWDYDDAQHIQHLAGLVSLCPACHQVKHMGRALQTGAGIAALQHLARVNALPVAEAVAIVQRALVCCQERSRHAWTLDVRILLTRYGVRLDDRGREVGLAY